MSEGRLRLGFPVKVMGNPAIKSNDTRRWANKPHLKVSLEYLEMRATLEAILKTWPDGVRPTVHFSTPRTEMREIVSKNRKTGKQEKSYAAPVWRSRRPWFLRDLSRAWERLAGPVDHPNSTGCGTERKRTVWGV